MACGGEERGQPEGNLTPTPVPIVQVQELTVVAFNVESNEASQEVVADLVDDVRGEALWAFSEVNGSGWLDALRRAAAVGESQPYGELLGRSGNNIHLALVWNLGILELLDSMELDAINVGGNVRAPLVGHFRLRATGGEFLVVVNHLYRSREDRRHEQARLLREWAEQQTLPIITLGDFNFDWNVINGEADHDQGYDILTQGGTFRWVRPAVLIKTQCSENYNSVLDFLFVAHGAKNWPAEAEILAPQADYCPDDAFKSDHRPVLGRFAVQGLLRP